MRIFAQLTVMLLAPTAIFASGEVRFRYDSGYIPSEFYQGIRVLPPPDYSRSVDPRLLVKPEGILRAGIQEISSEQAQIYVVFHAHKGKDVQQFITANQDRNMRLEIGDYVLPVDLEKTFPWMGKVWLQARPLTKARVILDSYMGDKE